MRSSSANKLRGGVTRSLSFRLGLSIVFGILITSFFATAGVVWRAVDRQAEERGLEIRAMAQVLSASISAGVADRDQAKIYDGLRTIQYSPRISYAQVSASDGTRLGHIGQQSVLVKEEGDAAWPTRLSRLLDPYGIVEEVQIRHAGETVGVLRLAGETTGAGAALEAELKNAAWWALAAILVGAIIAYYQQRRIIRPIAKLTDVMGRVSPEQELPTRVDVKGVGEVGVLVGSYNSMIEQVVQRDKVIADHTLHLEETIDARTRELRIARDQAEQAAEAKARFLATMSHEIRTPMNGVLVMAELLARSELKAEQKGYAKVIAQSGETLLDLLNDILDISKFDANHVSLESVPITVDDLVNDAIMVFYAQACAKGIELVASVRANVPSEIKGDPKRLRQCLTNLIGNALKFTASGYVAVDVSIDDQQNLSFAVSDTGVGISEDRRGAIFEAFEQEDISTSRVHGGTGLGLAIVARLTEAMKGDVSVTSTVGEGSCFTIRIPIVGAVFDEVTLAGEPRHVALVCDDQPALRDRLARQLTEVGLIAGAPTDADCILTTHALAETDSASPPVIGLWSFGASEPRAQLESGAFVDLLPVPFSRKVFSDLAGRIAEASYLGLDVLSSPPPDVLNADDDHAALRVLVADDGAVNRQVLSDALGIFHVAPVLVEDGAQAIQHAKDSEFDLILLDGSMPEVGGLAAAERIRENEELMAAPRAKIILFTASLESVSEDNWRPRGFDGTLSKPFQIAELSSLLQSCGTQAGVSAVAPLVNKSAKKAKARTDKNTWISSSVLETLYALDAKRPGALQRVFGRFLETLPEALHAVKVAITAKDAAVLHRTAHSLKSMCGSAGAVRLAEIAADLELSAAAIIEGGGSFDVPLDWSEAFDDAAQCSTEQIQSILSKVEAGRIKTS